MDNTPTKLRALTKLAAELDTSRRTVDRRRRDDPAFPRVITIRGRTYVESSAWEKYQSRPDPTRARRTGIRRRR